MWRSGIKTRLIELVGEGAQGRVFKALRVDRQTGLSQTVAIKILRSRTAVEMWGKEFDSLSRVRSPYCVQVLCHERVAGRPALVMEFIEGLSLAEMGRSGFGSAEDVVEVVAQIEAGLEDLRAHGVSHGDLSPANVMVDVTGRVRLLDFGLANQVNATLEFSAPERLVGHPATFAADLFSLGRIESFLAGPRPDGSESDYLRLDPLARRPRGATRCERRRADLGRKIALSLKQRAGVPSTQALVEDPGRDYESRAERVEGATRAARRARLAAIGAACAFLGSGRATPPNVARTGHLRLVTREWYAFRLDGRPIGFAPLDLTVPIGRHRLGYTSGRGIGTRLITIFAGRSLKLSDPDLTRFE